MKCLFWLIVFGYIVKKNEINVINYGRLKLERLVCENKVILIKGEMGIILKIKKNV